MQCCFIRLTFLSFLLSSCVLKTDSSLSVNPVNFPTLEFQINGGTAVTNNRLVHISYKSSREDVSEVSINQGTSCSEAGWTEATQSPSVTLNGGDGEKQISMIVKTPFGFKSPCITKAIVFDATGPRILSVSGPEDKNYSPGEVIEFEATFSEVATVVGTPAFKFMFGSGHRSANYLSGSGTSKLKFRYVTMSEDEGEAGIEVLGSLDIPIGSGIFDGLSNASTGDFLGSAFVNSRMWVAAQPEVHSVYIASFDKVISQESGEVSRFFTVATSEVQPVDVTVNYAFVSTSTATNPADHNLPKTGSVVIPANNQSEKNTL
jgi:hypothetical protein